MFIVSITYVKPLAEIDSFIPEHIEYLNTQYSLGNFQLSGPKVPRSGGVILATVKSRVELDEILSQDPFYREKLANYEIIAFTPTRSSEALALFIED